MFQKRRVSAFYLGDKDPKEEETDSSNAAANTSQPLTGGGMGDHQLESNQMVPPVGLLDRMKSRHNVISRKDNLILAPASKPLSKQNSVIQEAEPSTPGQFTAGVRIS